jgi:hypothetical protein
LELAGVSTLFMVPGLRTSDYVAMLSVVMPALTSFSPGSISVEALPQLKSLILVDNVFNESSFQKILSNTKCAMDFREIFVWQDSALDEQIAQIEQTMDKDDVINLQFTRFVN